MQMPDSNTTPQFHRPKTKRKVGVVATTVANVSSVEVKSDTTPAPVTANTAPVVPSSDTVAAPAPVKLKQPRKPKQKVAKMPEPTNYVFPGKSSKPEDALPTMPNFNFNFKTPDIVLTLSAALIASVIVIVLLATR